VYGVGTVNNKTQLDMIKKTKAFVTEDGTTHATLAAAQEYTLRGILENYAVGNIAAGKIDQDFIKDLAVYILSQADTVRACLPKPTRRKRTPKASVDPKLAKARKVLETGRGSFTTHEPK